MLRIAFGQTETEQRMTLSGQLTGPWIPELRRCWELNCRQAAADARPIIVDLSDVTFIDESGEMLLCAMRNRGAKFVTAGVETKHLIENLRAIGKRPLRRSMSPLACRCERPHVHKDGGTE
jgi:anti-anti-sigma regulatory factor